MCLTFMFVFGSVHGTVKSSTGNAYEKVFRPGSRVYTPIWIGSVFSPVNSVMS